MMAIKGCEPFGMASQAADRTGLRVVYSRSGHVAIARLWCSVHMAVGHDGYHCPSSSDDWSLNTACP